MPPLGLPLFVPNQRFAPEKRLLKCKLRKVSDILAFQGSSRPGQLCRGSIFQLVVNRSFTITIEPQFPWEKVFHVASAISQKLCSFPPFSYLDFLLVTTSWRSFSCFSTQGMRALMVKSRTSIRTRSMSLGLKICISRSSQYPGKT